MANTTEPIKVYILKENDYEPETLGVFRTPEAALAVASQHNKSNGDKLYIKRSSSWSGYKIMLDFYSEIQEKDTSTCLYILEEHTLGD